MANGQSCGKRIGVGDFFIGFHTYCKEHKPQVK